MTNAGVALPPRATVRASRSRSPFESVDPATNESLAWTPYGRGSTASQVRREIKRMSRALTPRLTRKQRLSLMRTGDEGATRADVTSLVRSMAHARRAGLL